MKNWNDAIYQTVRCMRAKAAWERSARALIVLPVQRLVCRWIESWCRTPVSREETGLHWSRYMHASDQVELDQRVIITAYRARTVQTVSRTYYHSTSHTRTSPAGQLCAPIVPAYVLGWSFSPVCCLLFLNSSPAKTKHGWMGRDGAVVHMCSCEISLLQYANDTLLFFTK